MAGRPRLPIGTFGEITTREVAPRRFRASARLRDWDGRTRQVSATSESASAARSALKARIAERMRAGDTSGALTADSPFADLADAWLEDLRMDSDRSDGTKEVYERELRSLVQPTFQHFTVREVTVGRIERFLKEQRSRSYARAKHSRTILSMVLGFAVRREIIARNPVKETSRLKKPKQVPKALTPEQIELIRRAAAEWRTGPGVLGPRPDGQVRDIIEFMLGTATRIGEALAIRKCDVDVTSEIPTVTIAGTIVVRRDRGVVRQGWTKTGESRRVAIPAFVAEVLRRRLVLLAGLPEDHLVFFTRNGTPLTPNNVRRTFREMLASVGLDEAEISPHAFRRTGATLLANRLDIETAAEVLGHSTPATTRDHYVEPSHAVDAVSALVLQRLGPLEAPRRPRLH
ncbi:tyrosine-type recombinase/integrase [Microbacterium terrae]|uniref:Tyrosine recombinase XerD n=2 Tax=Microbacterium terrae TaxID=69369 RepID=A0A0M2H0E9_9MICO|nr:Tyrosine recombinase XerD [Microbacterium terrae]GLJ97142.1 putative phage integrase [Microbacterium terrae]